MKIFRLGKNLTNGDFNLSKNENMSQESDK